MPEQRASEVTAVAKVLAASGQLADSVRTMLLEGLPHAASQGCKHPLQKEFMTLAGGVLEGAKRIVTEELVAVEVDLRAAEGKVEAIKFREAVAAAALEEALAGVADAEAKASAAAAAVHDAESEHQEVEGRSMAFLQHRQEKQEERVRAEAVIQGALRMLQDGAWDTEETKSDAIEAVEGLLGELRTDKVLLAAAPIALTTKPAGRGGYDIVSIDAVAKILSDHLFHLGSKLAETDLDEVNKRAEILGLWAIMDCARDVSADADAALASARRKQKSTQAELNAERSRLKVQDTDVVERLAKHARVTAQLSDVDEAMAAIERLVAGQAGADAKVEVADAKGQVVSEAAAS